MAAAMSVLAACGSTPASGPATAEPEDSVVVTSSPSGLSTPDASGASAGGASFGVDSTSWPDSMDAARTVLAALPEELRGEARELMPTLGEGEGELAAVAYGEGLSVLVSDDTVSGEPGAAPQVVGAQGKLAAMFGLMYICDPDTYEGTIERSADFPVPGYSEVDAGATAWFSCRIDGAEGAEEGFSAQAVGWTSGKTAWLTVGPDEAAVQELVTALQEAKG